MKGANSILMFCSTLWGNNLARTYPFYRALGGGKVVVAGWLKRGKDIYGPYKGKMHFLPLRLGASLPLDLLRLLREAARADVIHCFKPLWSSFLPARTLSWLFRKPLVLDIEDLDWQPDGRFSLNSLSHGMAKKVRVKTVHSRALQKLWGGNIVRTGADEIFFADHVHGGKKIRELYGLRDRFVITFAGSLRPHKGFDVMAAALEHLPENVILMVVGASDETSKAMLDDYRTRLGERIMLIPPQPFDKMPDFLAAADMVVLPQLNNPTAEHQIPAKLYDAMAAGKPVAVSDVGDMPEILGGTGIVFRAGDADACAGAIRQVMENPEWAKELGNAARERCRGLYSTDKTREELLAAYEDASG